jgi:hypothetical protein
MTQQKTREYHMYIMLNLTKACRVPDSDKLTHSYTMNFLPADVIQRYPHPSLRGYDFHLKGNPALMEYR